MSSRDGRRLHVHAVVGGEPRAHPDVEFEFGDKTYTGRAEVIRDWPNAIACGTAHVEQLPDFQPRTRNRPGE